jgi:hypothetical protein
MREQIAQQYPPRAKRQSPEQEASRHRAGHYAGIHPEDRPRTTGDPRRMQSQDAPARRYYVETDEVDEEESIYDPPSRSSVRRYAAPPQTHIQVTHHRASAQVQSRTKEQAARSRPALPPAHRLHWLFFIGIGMLVMLALWTGGNLVFSWWQTVQNDWHYGRPRTSQIDVRVGHNDTETPSHFLAVNLKGHIIVVEFPGGNAANAKAYIGPIMAQGHDLDPVTLDFRDVNGDGKPDMILSVAEVRQVFINDNGSFRPMRQGEKISL